MANPPLTFHPPYLRYDNPSDFAQIQARIKALKDRAAARGPKINVGHGTLSVNPDVFTIPENPRTDSQTPKTQVQIGTGRALNVDVAKKLESQSPQPSVRSAGIPGPLVEHKAENLQGILDLVSAGKAVSVHVANVSPQGNVSMGFNCKMTFHVTNDLECPDVYWYLNFKNPITGQYDMVAQYISQTSNPDPTDEMYFEIDFSTYNTAAYAAANGTASFKVYGQGYVYTSNGTVLPSASATSNEVILNFNAPPCISVYSIDLSENTFVGGKNDHEPTMTVAIDAPAPPGGQRIDLGVSNGNLAEIMGDGYFVIPAGQTSGSISWFLGTRKVYSDKSFDILVKASGSTHEGHAKIYLHKK
jgi:hypothetical protein